MVVRSSFFNSVGGDRIYDAPIFAEYFASFIGNGVFPNPSTSLQVLQATNLQTNVAAGRGWINGYYVNNTSNYILQHDIADGVLDRIDRVVFGLNLSTREITIYIKRGTPSASPVAPALVRNGTLHELALADVRINRGALAITQSNITDTRLNTSLCGYVTGLVQQLDTTTLFNQYQAFYNDLVTTSGQRIDNLIADGDQRFRTWETDARSEFEVWYAGVRDILEGDVAANLYNLINDVDSKIGNLSDLTTSNKNNIVGAVNELNTIPQQLVNHIDDTKLHVVYAQSDTLATENTKRVTISNFVSSVGTKIVVRFANALNGDMMFGVNSELALPVQYNNNQVKSGSYSPGTTLLLSKQSTYWEVLNPTNAMLQNINNNAFGVETPVTSFRRGYNYFNINTATGVNSVANALNYTLPNPNCTFLVEVLRTLGPEGINSENVMQTYTLINNNSGDNNKNGTILGIWKRVAKISNNAFGGWGNFIRIDNNIATQGASIQSAAFSLNEDGDGLTFTYKEG